MELNDELLCAYLDGELDADARAEFEAALATNSGARLRLDRLQRADEQLRDAFPLSDRDMEADPLAASILAFEPGKPQQHRGQPTRRPAQETRHWYRRRMVLAAMAAGISGLAIGALLITKQQVASQPALATADALSALLDRVASGEQVSEAGRTTKPVLSFRAGDGRYCRVFEQQDGTTAAEGLACRDGKSWQVLALEKSGVANDGLMHPAGGNAKIDQFMDRLGGEQAMDASEEKALIDHHWNGPKP